MKQGEGRSPTYSVLRKMRSSLSRMTTSKSVSHSILNKSINRVSEEGFRMAHKKKEIFRQFLQGKKTTRKFFSNGGKKLNKINNIVMQKWRRKKKRNCRINMMPSDNIHPLKKKKFVCI
ncbi:hypothetical protein ACKWTF_011633 [Chironomus riparius]